MTAYHIINWQVSSLDTTQVDIYNLSASLNETTKPTLRLFNNFFQVKYRGYTTSKWGKNQVGIHSSSEYSEGVCRSQHERAITRPAATEENHEKRLLGYSVNYQRFEPGNLGYKSATIPLINLLSVKW
jgi:hypothetical protein